MRTGIFIRRWLTLPNAGAPRAATRIKTDAGRSPHLSAPPLTLLDNRSTSVLVKRDARQAILDAGADLVHLQGFNRTGLAEILETAQVPKGSFYFYFKSKEDFGLALIDQYVAMAQERIGSVLQGQDRPPLERLRAMYAANRERYDAGGCMRGCPIGNLAQEMSDVSPALRQRLQQALDGIVGLLAGVLDEAVQRGDLPADLDTRQTAAFLLDAWEGALLRMKAEKSTAPLLRFEDVVFNRLLA